ncbi:MAG: hypothetical protein IPM45_05815 [Acidimicrobiales bacterium]|nr:hypothetical protein [Acidimicrobiales bacterium]
MEVLVLGAAFVGAGLLFTVMAFGRTRRLRELRAAVAAHGLAYSVEDPFGSATPPFELLRRGDVRGADNVVWRPGDPGGLRVFDYWWADEHQDRNGQIRRDYRRCTAATVEAGWLWPELTLDPETAITRAANHLGARDIEFESDEFNRMFSVHCDDRRFANAFLDARMIELLLSTRGECHVAVKNRWILVWTDRELPGRLVPGMLGLLDSIRDRVPRLVYEYWPLPVKPAPSAGAGT